MDNYIISAISTETGEVKEFHATVQCSASSHGVAQYMKFERDYINIHGRYKDEIEVYPEFNLIAVQTLVWDANKGDYISETGIPDMYTIDGIYKRI